MRAWPCRRAREPRRRACVECGIFFVLGMSMTRVERMFLRNATYGLRKDLVTFFFYPARVNRYDGNFLTIRRLFVYQGDH